MLEWSRNFLWQKPCSFVSGNVRPFIPLSGAPAIAAAVVIWNTPIGTPGQKLQCEGWHGVWSKFVALRLFG